MESLVDIWYMAGCGSELGRGVLLARKLLDRPVLLVGDAAGVRVRRLLDNLIQSELPHR
ncbi:MULTISPECIES: hypothetical protein [Paraburkholderia]|uniref:hypothetical protein n=1 Tax=Paraburkholderia TaxID=1822464 RepID=UPI000F251363|nr:MULTISPECIES: hypothetical protein [Paraburkholderia]RKR31338.1 hypothetical protein B0G82_7483 [Paraburkholderia sp. BL17N1]